MPQAAVRPQEHVLRQVAGILVIADETIAELIDAAAMPLDDDVERAIMAAEARRNQVGLAEPAE